MGIPHFKTNYVFSGLHTSLIKLFAGLVGIAYRILESAGKDKDRITGRDKCYLYSGEKKDRL